MAIISIQSKLIEAIDYDEDEKNLTVFLYNGERRAYSGVSKGQVVGLTVAASPGNYYMTEIRGKYPAL